MSKHITHPTPALVQEYQNAKHHLALNPALQQAVLDGSARMYVNDDAGVGVSIGTLSETSVHIYLSMPTIKVLVWGQKNDLLLSI